jgi:hypothetical protein
VSSSGGCLDGIQGGTVVDLTADFVDVENVICDVQIDKVVKAEPGEAEVVMKAEGGTDASPVKAVSSSGGGQSHD